ncbi:BTAD domain-containing putative transcriptional regulator [Streptomyces sp. HNM0663]|uniref:BTAD domain-containing putative transcriptional regulator n=1 Tax=Streptomyces chengmaiensis TaxID=3040919 RepID=A0ABT6HXQ8_9ACTN|nr:BTAD domain-containing putative transcriptional regulator [Streptomyces chengmaiensis]MDH2393491.1 BTAD domain-containing putative transcriptional regulator [Streptomyces chengmaiensis]
MEFRLLGTVEAHHAGREVDIGHRRQRAVLAILLTEANRVITADRLRDRLWPYDPPSGAPRTLHSYLSRLRTALSAARDVNIERRAGGYMLSVDPRAVDLHRFRELTAHARSAEGSRVELFDEALALWRGQAFDGLDLPWLLDTRAALAAERRAAWLDRNDALLDAGDHTAVLAELAGENGVDALDERIAAQSMLALYRGGRQAEALDAYERLRRALAERLGSDPGPRLRELHRQILTADPALLTRQQPAAALSQPPVPRQLPPRPSGFTGRAEALTRLSEAVPVTVISGPGGVGKTWLALRWAHGVRAAFPDGQLYVNLRGFDACDTPTPPAEALRRLLESLGVPGDAIPPDLDGRTARFRSLVANRRMLVLLDNARDSAQVRPLLPGGDGCTTLITSRHRLTALVTESGAAHLTLSAMNAEESHATLAGALGPARLDADPGARAALVAHCGGLPLALSILAARAAAEPELPLAALAAELSDDRTRLDALDTGELHTDLRAVLTASVKALTPQAARAFALMGLVPGAGWALHPAASLTALPPAACRRALRELLNAHLLEQYAPGRYRFHDLTGLYAAELAPDPASPEGAGALRRFVDHYAFSVYRDSAYLRMAVHFDGDAGPAPDVVVETHTEDDTLVEWFTAEYEPLRTAQAIAHDRGWEQPLWMLALPTAYHQLMRGHTEESLASSRRALLAAGRLGLRSAVSQAHQMLGLALFSATGDDDAALQALHDGVAAAETAADPLVRVQARWALCSVTSSLEQHETALSHARSALAIAEESGVDLIIGMGLNTVGWCLAQLDEYDDAYAHCEQALHRLPDGTTRLLTCHVRESLGYISSRSGRLHEALHHYDAAVAMFAAGRVDVHLAEALLSRGEIHHALGDLDQARRDWQQARDQHRSRGDTRREERATALLATMAAPDRLA